MTLLNSDFTDGGWLAKYQTFCGKQCLFTFYFRIAQFESEKDSGTTYKAT